MEDGEVIRSTDDDGDGVKGPGWSCEVPANMVAAAKHRGTTAAMEEPPWRSRHGGTEHRGGRRALQARRSTPPAQAPRRRPGSSDGATAAMAAEHGGHPRALQVRGQPGRREPRRRARRSSPPSTAGTSLSPRSARPTCPQVDVAEPCRHAAAATTVQAVIAATANTTAATENQFAKTSLPQHLPCGCKAQHAAPCETRGTVRCEVCHTLVCLRCRRIDLVEAVPTFRCCVCMKQHEFQEFIDALSSLASDGVDFGTPPTSQ